jgi:subtilisin family serine protease
MGTSRRRARGSARGAERPRRAEPGGEPRGAGVPALGPGADVGAPGTTGRYLVLLRPNAIRASMRAMTDAAGLHVASTADFEGGVVDPDRLAGGEAIVFDRLGVAVVDTPPEQLRALSATATEDSGILAIEPERVVYALAEEGPRSAETPAPPRVPEPPFTPPAPRLSVEYLLGYREAVNHLVDQVLAASGLPAGARTGAGAMLAALDESELTWGLQVTRVAASQFSGRGIRVAVLDTGLDLEHPDFVGRPIVASSFVSGEEVQDGHGHGTHCIGTACGPKQPGQLPRYGIAYDAEIFAGKVLSNRGSGADAGILAGIQWAITNGCQIISMSLGANLCEQPNQGYSRIFESVARRALAAGTLIIAAAGNDSERPGHICPVSHPANCPSIMAVSALDQQLHVASFSNGGLNPQGGQVDIAGPGVAVRSTWPRPLLYRTISGTSMATPHVAGLAALLAEADPEARGRVLASLLLQTARRLELPARDVGSGLGQAP